jgi:uncharacterized protein
MEVSIHNYIIVEICHLRYSHIPEEIGRTSCFSPLAPGTDGGARRILYKGAHMICPRCNKHTLEEREKDGVTIDVCQECRGVWLDRGELERLIARAAQEMDGKADARGTNDAYQGRHDNHDRHHGHDEHEKHHSYGDHSRHEGPHYRKRHWLAEIFD